MLVTRLKAHGKIHSLLLLTRQPLKIRWTVRSINWKLLLSGLKRWYGASSELGPTLISEVLESSWSNIDPRSRTRSA